MADQQYNVNKADLLASPFDQWFGPDATGLPPDNEIDWSISSKGKIAPGFCILEVGEGPNDARPEEKKPGPHGFGKNPFPENSGCQIIEHDPDRGPLAGALCVASLGFRVHPLKPGRKEPLLTGWPERASDQAEVIRQWAADHPGCNFGAVGGSGRFAVDVDVKGDKNGVADLAALEAAHGALPKTFTVRTPSGGLHYYFSGDDVATSGGTLAPGIDVRGVDGYVVAPGSYFADYPDKKGEQKGYTGFYRVEHDRPVAVAPPWLILMAGEHRRRGERPPALSEDEPEDIARAIRHLQTTRPAVAGQRGHYRTLEVARDLSDFGVGEDTAAELMLEHFDPRCEPPWEATDPGALRKKVEGAYATCQSSQGYLATKIVAASFEDALPLDQIPGATDAFGRASRFFSAADFAGKSVPPRDWLVPRFIPGRNVTTLGGDGGTGKSLAAMQLAVSAVLGCTWLGQPVKRGPVIYLSAEDDEDELHRRVDAILRSCWGSYEDLAGLTLRSLAGEDALLANDLGDRLALTESALFHELDACAAREKPVLAVIDTLADVYPANENDRAKVRQFIGLLRGLAIKHTCAVLLLAHPSLSGMANGSGSSGSTAWNNSVRSRLYLTTATTPGNLPPNPDKRVLEVKKANYGQGGETIAMVWREGVFVVDEGAVAGLDRDAQAALAQTVFMELLRLHGAQGRAVNPSAGVNYAPSVFADHPDARGYTKHAFKAAMEALLNAGKIAVAEKGPPSRRVKFLKEVED